MARSSAECVTNARPGLTPMRTSCLFRLAVLIWVLPVGLSFCQMDQLRPEPPGKLVDIGGRKLHVYCTGKGGPSVILESGAGSFSTDCALVQPEIANKTRVCSHDRAGYGWSDPGPEWDSTTQVASDLQIALSKAGEHPPTYS